MTRFLTLLLFSFFCFTGVLSSQTNSANPVFIAQGVTSPNQWQNFNPNGGGTPAGIFVQVNTSGCGFPTTPHYIATLEAAGSHWVMSGVSSIYNASPTGFRVYIRFTDHPTDEPMVSNVFPNPLTSTTANNLGLVVRWTAISTGSFDCGSVQTNFDFPDQDPNNLVLELDNVNKDIMDSETLDFLISPNPSRDEITIRSKAIFDEYEIYSMDGQFISKYSTTPIDISSLSNGSYVIRAIQTNSGASKTHIFTKE